MENKNKVVFKLTEAQLKDISSNPEIGKRTLTSAYYKWGVLHATYITYVCHITRKLLYELEVPGFFRSSDVVISKSAFLDYAFYESFFFKEDVSQKVLKLFAVIKSNEHPSFHSNFGNKEDAEKNLPEGVFFDGSIMVAIKPVLNSFKQFEGNLSEI